MKKMKFSTAKIETILAYYEGQSEDEAVKEDEEFSTAMSENNEVGRELSIEDLKPGTVVCVRAKGRTTMVTLFVEKVEDDMVWLLSNLPNRPEIHFGCFRSADGTLRDDSGKSIQLFEFLGKP